MSFDAILEREVIARRRSAIYEALLVIVALAISGAIVWTYA